MAFVKKGGHQGQKFGLHMQKPVELKEMPVATVQVAGWALNHAGTQM